MFQSANRHGDEHRLIPRDRLQRTRNCLGLVGVVAVAMVWDNSFLSAAPDDRPNIVVIMCDDLGFSDIGCYGGEIDTPNLDRLAAGGLRFTDFHNNAKCSETRASLLSGLWHQQSQNLNKPNQLTLADVLKSAGYSTLMSGKWHLSGLPTDHGFDRYFGFLSGCINYFTGVDWGTGTNLMRLDRKPFDVPDRFYATNALTDYALEFLDAADDQKPFFLYLAYNAPHFPLQALPEDIAKYRGRYDQGWDVIRQARARRLRELGVTDDTWRLSARDPQIEAWSEVTDQQAEFLLPMIEVYAAMVDRLDKNVGRLVDYLSAQDKLENTLLLFLSDNGACPYQRWRTDVRVPGPADSDFAYDARWANMCNTPLRLYKQYAHAGGTLTPMIAHWPRGIDARGELTAWTAHVVDLMPTIVELAGGHYPTSWDGRQILPMEGESLLPALRGVTQQRARPIFWDYRGHHAVREGKWKLVAERGKDWELYDMSLDRCETMDLSARFPQQVMRLGATYDRWAARTGAKSHDQATLLKPSQQSQMFDLEAALEHLQ